MLNVDGDSAITPKSKLGADSRQPDEGWDYNKTNPSKSLTKYYRDKAKIFTKTLSEAVSNRLLLRTQDQDIWYEKNKKEFTKK